MNKPKEIQLFHGEIALVSPEDFEMASLYKWHLSSHGYVRRAETGGARIYLHREVNRTPAGMATDHIDGNKLNNTRENLRTVDDAQNAGNQRKRYGDLSSQFKGVCFIPGRGKNPAKSARWVAYVTQNQVRHHLGHFTTELDAAFAYNLKAQELFGEYAQLNPLPVDYLEAHKEPTLFCFRKHSKYRGVCYNKTLKYWTAIMVKDGKKVLSSYHKTELEAAQAWNAAALVHHGPLAKLNHLHA